MPLRLGGPHATMGVRLLPAAFVIGLTACAGTKLAPTAGAEAQGPARASGADCALVLERLAGGTGEVADLAILAPGANGLAPALEPALARRLKGSGQGHEAPCSLLVEAVPGTLSAQARTVGREQRQSEKRVATNRRLNPDYAAARDRLRKAEGDRDARAGGRGLESSGDPTLDLLGLALSGISSGVGFLLDWRERANAEQDLQETPRFIEEASYEPYTLELQTLELERTVRFRALLADRRQGTFRTLELPVAHRTTVAIGRSLDEQDRARLENRAGYLSVAEARELQQRPPPLSAQTLAAMARGFATAPVTAADPASAIDAWERSAQAVATAPVAASGGAEDVAPAASIVAVEGLGGRGQGIYITPEHVLTARSLIGATSLIKVTTADGVVTYGIVEREDPGRDLAIIYVQKPGAPVAVAAGAEPARAAWDAAPGTPVLVGGRLAGLAVADAPEGIIPADALASFSRGLATPPGGSDTRADLASAALP